MATYKPTPSSSYHKASASGSRGEDPYSPSIAQELLQGTNEWINIQDIVKLTFKALFDVVKTQGDAIHELEQTVPTKANKAELNAGLSLKANISDVSKTFAEVVANVESRATVEEVQGALAEKAARTDLDRLEATKVGREEIKQVAGMKAEIEEELSRMFDRIETVQRDLQSKLAATASAKQLEDLRAALSLKANIAEVNDSLQKKAGKDSITAALLKKVNQKDIESLLARKVDLADLQKLIAAVERKVDSTDLEILQKRQDMKMGEIETMTKEMKMKASCKDLDVAVSSLAESQRIEREKLAIDTERQINEIRKSLKDELAALQRGLEKKIGVVEFDELRGQMLKQKDAGEVAATLAKTKEDMGRQVTELKVQVETLRRKLEEGVQTELARVSRITETELQKVRDQAQTISEDRKRECEETSKYFSNLSNTVKAQIEDEQRSIQREVQDIRKEVESVAHKTGEHKETLQRLLDPKADVAEVQQAITESQTLVARRLTELKEDFKREIAGVRAQVEQKANVNDVNAKVEQSVLVAAMQEKANLSEFEVLAGRVEAFQGELDKKLDRQELEAHDAEGKDQIADVHKELLLKANIKDVCTLVDVKANSEDVKKGLAELRTELDKKTNSEDFSAAMADQSLINEALCAENCVGRWVWRSGEVKNGYAVPWEAQSVNTCPDNFLWEKDKTSIMTIASGLYEVKLGFFAPKPPTIQVLMNGEPILIPGKVSASGSRYCTKKSDLATRCR